MNISELTIDKVEQCIVNEQNRLSNILETYEKLKNEYTQKWEKYNTELSIMENKIIKLEHSIKCAKVFIQECENKKQQLLNN